MFVEVRDDILRRGEGGEGEEGEAAGLIVLVEVGQAEVRVISDWRVAGAES